MQIETNALPCRLVHAPLARRLLRLGRYFAIGLPKNKEGNGELISLRTWPLITLIHPKACFFAAPSPRKRALNAPHQTKSFGRVHANKCSRIVVTVGPDDLVHDQGGKG